MQVRFAYRRPDSDRSQDFVFDHPDGDWIGTQQQAVQTFYERPLLEALLAAYRWHADTDIVVDVGAHVGNHSVFFSDVMRVSTLAVEPNPDVWPYLLTNAMRCERVVPVLGAVGAAPGWATSGLIPARVGAGNCPPNAHLTAPLNTGMAQVEVYDDGMYSPKLSGMVPVWRVDDLVPSPATVGLLKIDCEGMELEVLAGAVRVLREERPVLAIEAQTEEALVQQEAFLRRFGYTYGVRYCATPTYLWTPT